MPQIGTKGSELDLLIRQGATFGPNTCRLTNQDSTPINLTGATLRAQVRKTPTSTLVPGATGTFVITNAANGEFTWSFTAAATTAMPAGSESETETSSIYVWDMELEDSIGRVIPLLYGKVYVFREVTKVD